jgi:predicted phosphodiesterase
LSVMRIGAFGDLHGDRFMEFLIPSLGDLAEIDLLLLAGDVVDKDDIDSFARTLELIRRTTDAKIISVFGNEEYSQSYEEYRERFAITFLDDESISLTARWTGQRGGSGPTCQEYGRGTGNGWGGYRSFWLGERRISSSC